jgi:hypothetical protein
MNRQSNGGFGLALFLLAAIVFGNYLAEASELLTDRVRQVQDAGVPAPTVNRVLAVGLERQVDPAVISEYLDLLGAAASQGLPLEPFSNKIEEGFAKNIPAPIIATVLRQRLENYVEMRSLVAEYQGAHNEKAPVPSEYLMRMAESLYSGITLEDVRHLLAESPGKSLPALTSGMEALASLRSIQFDHELSDRVVAAGLKGRFFDEYGWTDFVRVVEAARNKGIEEKDIAAEAFSLMAGKLSLAAFSSRLGVSHNELGRRGPRVGKGRAADRGQRRSGHLSGDDRGFGRSSEGAGRGSGGGSGSGSGSGDGSGAGGGGGSGDGGGGSGGGSGGGGSGGGDGSGGGHG